MMRDVRRWSRVGLVWGLTAFLMGCGSHGVVYTLTEGALYSETDDCAPIPERPPSQLNATLATMSEELESGRTGIHVLEDGAGALMARAWLASNATKSIDIQYFIFSADALGLVAADELLRAAERGVKVRLLVDDLLYDGDASFLLALDAHPNMEVRIYNPSINIGKSLPSRIVGLVRDYRGANQRMHNKTFIVDGQVVITGGRNIADEYFDFSHDYNFRDRDMLMIGGAVSQVNGSFEQFWTDDLVVPLTSILKDKVDHEAVWTQLHRFACRPENYWPEVRARVRRVPERFKELRDANTLRWVENVRFVSDLPGKNDGRADMKGGGLSTDALIDLVSSAEREVVIQTPYLVTTRLGKDVFRAAVKRGVKVKILTNSLAATDSYPAFSGYVRDREELLETGVEIYEFRPYGPVSKKLMTSALMKTKPKLTRFGLHAKSMVIDGRTLMVGTFNLDPRSANLNTECIVIVDDPPLAQGVLAWMNEEMSPANAWRTTKDWNPDHKAPCSKRWKLFWARPIPKEIL